MAVQGVIDGAKLDAFLGKAVEELSATASAGLVVMGDKLGLYKAMAGAGPVTPDELAARTGTNERLVREWLCNQAAGGFVDYDPDGGVFTLPPEQAYVLADPSAPVDLAGAYRLILSCLRDEPKITEAFRHGDGLAWNDHDAELFGGTDRFFAPGYRATLVSAWIPTLTGVVAKLEAGARVADIGCGFGSSTIIMAEAYPRSTFTGFDFHAESIGAARQKAADAGVVGRVRFEVAETTDFPGAPYDLITTFDTLHDTGDPAGFAAHVLRSLTTDGTWMIVEPRAGDRLEDNLNPVGRLYYAASTVICVPCAQSQSGSHTLGAQAGEARLRAVATGAGFTRFRRAAEGPFNLVLEARP